MKKAATHIEWVISMGIFLIFIISLFIVLKPGYKQPFAGDTLLNILEDNFNEEVYWTIKKTPLFISQCNEPGQEVIVKLCDINGQEGCTQSVWKFSANDMDTLSFTNNAVEQLIYYPTGSDDVTLKFEKNDCSATFGITEDLTGISGDKLDALRSIQNAESLKEKWKYPKNQEFSIKIKKETDVDFKEFKTSDIEPSNIYSKEFKTWLLDKNANKQIIIVNLQVW